MPPVHRPFFDLASVTKALVTAPLVHRHLDLNEDGRTRFALPHHPVPLTPRALLCHAAGLPPWLPYTGAPLADQLAQGFPAGSHFLLRAGTPGVAQYSDLHYRLLAEWLEQATGRPFAQLGQEATGLLPAPWPDPPAWLDDGPDAEAWPLAAPGTPLPVRSPLAPHDANARAGMRGHAGFGGDPGLLQAALDRWLAEDWPTRMAVPSAQSAEGTVWGLGLQQLTSGPGTFGHLLEGLPEDLRGGHLVFQAGDACPPEAPPVTPGAPSEWWVHLGWTGCALFVHPRRRTAVLLLCHRRDPEGRTLDMSFLRHRRWEALSRWAGLH